MQVVILAAGTGNRLMPLTRELPKALIEVNGTPLIDYAIEFAGFLDAREILVVGGFGFEKLRDHLFSHQPPVRLLENKAYLKGNIFSLIEALPHLQNDFLLMNVDHIYPRALANRFTAIRSNITAITAFVDFDRPLGEDDMKVGMANHDAISEISKSLSEYDGGYIGMTYVPREKLKMYSRSAIEIANKNDKAVVEQILQTLINSGEPVQIFSANKIRWLEVDNLTDLENARRILRWVPDFLN